MVPEYELTEHVNRMQSILASSSNNITFEIASDTFYTNILLLEHVSPEREKYLLTCGNALIKIGGVPLINKCRQKNHNTDYIVHVIVLRYCDKLQQKSSHYIIL